MKILVSGFEAFHKNDENPSQEVVRLLPETLKGHTIIPLELPVRYDLCFELLRVVLETEKPDVIINLGLAQGRQHITPERIAINLDDASIPDNNGTLRQGAKIELDADNAYFSTLPVGLIVDRLLKKGIPAKVSNHAGTYICNHLMYQTLHYIKVNNLNIKAGFIHLPLMDEQNKDKTIFSLPLQTLLEAILDAIDVCL